MTEKIKVKRERWEDLNLKIKGLDERICTQKQLINKDVHQVDLNHKAWVNGKSKKVELKRREKIVEAIYLVFQMRMMNQQRKKEVQEK